MSEPGGGSDVAAATTTARRWTIGNPIIAAPIIRKSFERISTDTFRVGDDLVINGQKMWITNAFQVDFFMHTIFPMPFRLVHSQQISNHHQPNYILHVFKNPFKIVHQADWMCLLANTREGNRE